MVRFIASALFLGLTILSACAKTGVVSATPTTAGRVPNACLDEDVTCARSADCCSSRCDNGVCVRKEP